MKRVLYLAAPILAAVAIVACSGAPEERNTFDRDAGSPETGASLPPTADGSADAPAAPDAMPPFDPKEEPVTCAGSPCAKQLVAGDAHFCALLSDGTVKCWGADQPVAAVTGLAGVTQISAGGKTTCALVAGAVHCWGGNEKGELGLTIDPPTFDFDPHPDPTPVALADLSLGAIARVDVGHGSVCATATSGKVACWGNEHRAQLANKPFDPFELDPYRGPAIAAISPLSPVRTLVGGATAIGVTSNGEVWSWGAIAGEDGTASGRIASVSPDPRPARIASLSDVRAIAVSGMIFPEPPPIEPGPFPQPDPPPPPPRAHACAIAGNGAIYCWGRSYTGALCTGLPDHEQTPRLAPMTAKDWPQQLAVADEVTCARLSDGTVQCCGDDRQGKLGTGTASLYSPNFVEAKAFTGHAVHVATADAAVCVLVQGGTVECWGGNPHGELGNGTPDDNAHPAPVKVAF